MPDGCDVCGWGGVNDGVNRRLTCLSCEAWGRHWVGELRMSRWRRLCRRIWAAALGDAKRRTDA